MLTANYKAAPELLEEWFGNKQVIISSHMDALLKITTLKSATDIIQLRQVYVHKEMNVRGLKLLDVPTESYGSLLVPMLSKLPKEICLLVGTKIKDSNWNTDQLLKLPCEEVQN